MEKYYSVIFSGLSKPEDHFKAEMSKLGLSAENINRILRRVPVILKADMSRKQAERYAYAVEKAGGVVKIREYNIMKSGVRDDITMNIEPLEHFTMCRQCGHKQKKKEFCVKCGFELFKE